MCNSLLSSRHTTRFTICPSLSTFPCFWCLASALCLSNFQSLFSFRLLWHIKLVSVALLTGNFPCVSAILFGGSLTAGVPLYSPLLRELSRVLSIQWWDNVWWLDFLRDLRGLWVAASLPLRTHGNYLRLEMSLLHWNQTLRPRWIMKYLFSIRVSVRCLHMRTGGGERHWNQSSEISFQMSPLIVKGSFCVF